MTATEQTAADRLAVEEAARYATWFACLADPTRVRLLHAVAVAGEVAVGVLAEQIGIGQPTCSHHVRKLADVGFVRLRKSGTTTLVSVNEACCTGLPHAADVVMGALAARPCCPENLPADVTVRALTEADWPAVRRSYGEGIATRAATFETEVPRREILDRRWLPGHRWVAEVDGQIAGWSALSPVSPRECYAGVAETALYVAADYRRRGVGKSLLHRQVTAADTAGLWTLQTTILTENKPALALYRSAGFRTVGIRERLAQLDGRWRDTALLERRTDSTQPTCNPATC
ncbi:MULTISPECIES: metalloregulator ArsR/SmtB family transcription factor [unclassified Crossiella]|uniref:helix-turn-helix domain-containing GNAT family N-acetyltransferase n=1 Tax=unclassified Crossiella TaxID=2620835 RepID=UPI001FFEADF9|nr:MULTISPECIES: metalloregulator ArsR/SmtB family transcription factor [unclassified Crossiella]MCK2244123.1 metalloregulator ArsR/SmtB family transcription factor [Crossiella sp. S99.2]MCK2257927.1 metalloregulator ArsR/SmtB family transcription factor [Crossiella sp. S99.1]